MKKMAALWMILALIVSSALSGAEAQERADRPNVIVVLTDDQGYGDFSVTGNQVLRTPNLDRLAAQSIRFGNFHVTPLCTPSRGELMTGVDALRNGACTVGTGRDFLRRDLVTLPELFRTSGYRTGIFGKWHLGDHYPDRPMDRGFEHCIWFRGWGLLSESEFDNDYFNTRFLDSLSPRKSDKYCTDLWFDQAMQWMGKMHAAGKPFFAYLATNAPHGPLYAPARDVAFYRGRVQDPKTAKFLGMIRDIDRNMGRLEQWLIGEHLVDHTLLIFMNDNGGTAGVDLYNAGMRGKKGSNYDGGHRGVCFIRWPGGNLRSAATINTLAEIQDILPTCVALCGLKPPPRPTDGISLAPVLHGSAGDTGRMVVVQYGGSVRPKKYDGCVLWKDWRLVGPGELYHLSEDPGERHNLVTEHPEIAARMRSFYDRWWKGLSPDWDHFIPLVAGDPHENPVTLTSDYWADSAYVNTQWKVAQAGGPPQGGTWHIRAVRGGIYRFELCRWPPELNRSLVEAGPDTAEGGTRMRAGRPVPVEAGCLSIDGHTSEGSSPGPQASKIMITQKITGGDHTVRAWFRDSQGHDLCGAYYLRVTRMGN